MSDAVRRSAKLMAMVQSEVDRQRIAIDSMKGAVRVVVTVTEFNQKPDRVAIDIATARDVRV